MLLLSMDCVPGVDLI